MPGSDDHQHARADRLGGEDLEVRRSGRGDRLERRRRPARSAPGRRRPPTAAAASIIGLAAAAVWPRRGRRWDVGHGLPPRVGAGGRYLRVKDCTTARSDGASPPAAASRGRHDRRAGPTARHRRGLRDHARSSTATTAGVFLEWFKAAAVPGDDRPRPRPGPGQLLGVAGRRAPRHPLLRRPSGPGEVRHVRAAGPSSTSPSTCASGRRRSVSGTACCSTTSTAAGIYLAEGLGHAFMSLADDVDGRVPLLDRVRARSTSTGSIRSIRQIAIAWPTSGLDGAPLTPVLSDRDGAAPGLRAALEAGTLPVWSAA